MKTRVLLVRHGATVLTAEDRFAGSTDVLLSENGERQAQCLRDRLASVPIAAVYASPMKRTVKTAGIIAEPHGLELVLEPGLREISHGHWEEKTRAEVEAEYPGEYVSWDADPFTYAPPEGESGLQVLSRALPPIREIVERHAGQTVLIVSHKATIRLIIGSFLGFDLRRYRDNLDQKPCCLNILDFTVSKPIKARLSLFNDTSHYDKSPETEETGPHLSKIWSTSAASSSKK
eukprot:m.107031 g.107031  ORF g.107031 m.107031 type:complete len:233 (-) comp15171_c0_seq2:2480-3178(-)